MRQSQRIIIYLYINIYRIPQLGREKHIFPFSIVIFFSLFVLMLHFVFFICFLFCYSQRAHTYFYIHKNKTKIQAFNNKHTNKRQTNKQIFTFKIQQNQTKRNVTFFQTNGTRSKSICGLSTCL